MNEEFLGRSKTSQNPGPTGKRLGKPIIQPSTSLDSAMSRLQISGGDKKPSWFKGGRGLEKYVGNGSAIGNPFQNKERNTFILNNHPSNANDMNQGFKLDKHSIGKTSKVKVGIPSPSKDALALNYFKKSIKQEIEPELVLDSVKPDMSLQRVLHGSDGQTMILQMPNRNQVQKKKESGVLLPLEIVQFDPAKTCSNSSTRQDNLLDFHVLESVMMVLKPHQLTGLKWLISTEMNPSHCGGMLADEMGLGKTFQMTLLMACRPGKTLIVVPASLLQQWKDEILKAISLKVHLFYDGKYHLQGDEQVVITTYNILRCSNSGKLMDINWYRVILDEAHTIKNHKTKTAEACFNLKS